MATNKCNDCTFMVTRPDGVHLCLRNVVKKDCGKGEAVPCFLAVDPDHSCDKFKAIGK